MNNYHKYHNSHRYRKQKSKHTAGSGLLKLLLCLVCCLTLLAAVGIFKNNFPFSSGNANPANTLTLKLSDSDETSWYLILVNKWNYIPGNYKVELIKLKNGESVDKRIYPALQKMFDAARKDAIYPVVGSGYRTTEKQQELMDQKIAEYKSIGYSDEEASTKAESWVAIPGTSEHQLGLGIDINGDDVHSTNEEVYEWLNKNSYKYGFILRYPSDKTEITGVINEPWHYRYVGVNAATQIYEQNVCLEEYLHARS